MNETLRDCQKCRHCLTTSGNSNTRLVLPFTKCIFTNRLCLDNEAEALRRRHGLHNQHLWLPHHKEGIIEDCYKRLVEAVPPKQLTTWSKIKVISHKPLSKQKTYRAAMETLKHKPLCPHDFNIKMFIKNERMDVNEDLDYLMPLKPPRAIQSRSPRANLCLQQYLNPIEQHLFHNPNNNHFSKCFNNRKKAQVLRRKWDLFRDPVAILLDHTAFDSRIHSGWLTKLEHKYYSQFYIGDDEITDMLAQQIDNHGKTAHGGMYTVYGTRMSGDANTSLGNSIINLGILLHFMNGVKAEYLLDGDDSVVIIERKDLHQLDFNKRLQSLGFSTKYSVVDEFEQIDFCQCKPVKTINGWVMIRDPMRTMSRATVCIDKNYRELELFKRWLHSVGTCEMSVNAGVPVLQSFASALMKFHVKPVTLSRNDGYRYDLSSKFQKFQITAEARRSFSLAFGLSVKEQLNLESYFDTLHLRDLVMNDVERPTMPTRFFTSY